MKLRVLYFGILRERLGRREETRELADGSTVKDLVADLCASENIFALGAASIRFAVNREYVGEAHALADGDEVAVIPPVAGGCGAINRNARAGVRRREPSQRVPGR